ncbi:MAG: hypothetical protein Q9196_003744 [Gyalolechia fulgens]
MAPVTTSTTSDVDTEFVSHVEFDRFFDLQAVGIRREFRGVHEKIDESQKSNDRRFKGVHEKIDELQKSNDRKFDEVHGKIDELKKSNDRKFDEVDRRFEQVDRRFTSLTLEVQNMAARLRNSALTRLHQPVHVIRVLDQSQNLDGIPIVPAHFPSNVKAFLALRKNSKMPSYRVAETIANYPASSLTSLCQSYGCLAWESWHRFQSDDSGSGSDGQSPDPDCPGTLEEAVESYTEMALRDLAEVWGLDVDRLDEELRRFKEFSRIHGRGSQKQRKRSPISLGAAQDVKRQRPSSTRQNPPSPLYPTSADPELLKLLLSEKSSSPGMSEPSVHTQLGWAANSEEFERYQTARKEGKTWKPETGHERLLRLTRRPTVEPKES